MEFFKLYIIFINVCCGPSYRGDSFRRRVLRNQSSTPTLSLMGEAILMQYSVLPFYPCTIQSELLITPLRQGVLSYSIILGAFSKPVEIDRQIFLTLMLNYNCFPPLIEWDYSSTE